MDARERLLHLLSQKSFFYDPQGGFTLSSGRKSNVYIDAKRTLLSSQGMVLVGRVFFESLRDVSAEAIGGLTLGADPIAYATALTSTLEGRPLDVFIVRKEPKGYGTQRWIEGGLEKGSQVVVIDDVLTTGTSTLKAIERVEEAGFTVKKVMALVDRQEGGRERIEERVTCPFEAIFTKEELLRVYRERGCG